VSSTQPFTVIPLLSQYAVHSALPPAVCGQPREQTVAAAAGVAGIVSRPSSISVPARNPAILRKAIAPPLIGTLERSMERIRTGDELAICHGAAVTTDN
jgi:hypothetical protein